MGLPHEHVRSICDGGGCSKTDPTDSQHCHPDRSWPPLASARTRRQRGSTCCLIDLLRVSRARKTPVLSPPQPPDGRTHNLRQARPSQTTVSPARTGQASMRVLVGVNPPLLGSLPFNVGSPFPHTPIPRYRSTMQKHKGALPERYQALPERYQALPERYQALPERYRRVFVGVFP